VTANDSRPILVLGATCKTGRRVAERLAERSTDSTTAAAVSGVWSTR
jgi:uncharacterized protein YbjT (DUF2867 family)